MTLYRIEAASVPEPDDRDWSEVRTDLDCVEAVELCRTLSNTPGAQPHFRVVSVATGKYLLWLSSMGAA